MDPAYRIPLAPGTPFFPVSPERANQQKHHHHHHPLHDIVPSPSMPNLTVASSRPPADVQGKVAQFNSLNKDAAERKREHDASLRRAMVGREEAESETKRVKDESKQIVRELEHSRSREGRLGERLDRMMVCICIFYMYKTLACHRRRFRIRLTDGCLGGAASHQRNTFAISNGLREGDTSSSQGGVQGGVGDCEIARRAQRHERVVSVVAI